jgi:hypothetical protein
VPLCSPESASVSRYWYVLYLCVFTVNVRCSNFKQCIDCWENNVLYIRPEFFNNKRRTDICHITRKRVRQCAADLSRILAWLTVDCSDDSITHSMAILLHPRVYIWARAKRTHVAFGVKVTRSKPVLFLWSVAVPARPDPTGSLTTFVFCVSSVVLRFCASSECVVCRERTVGRDVPLIY